MKSRTIGVARALGILRLGLCSLTVASVGLSAAGCGPPGPPESVKNVSSALTRVADSPTIVVADTLESLVASGRATEADRRYAYHLVHDRPVKTAADAFGRAAIAGRLAQLKGLGARGLVGEIERYARMSRKLDPTFRHGAAQRMLGTLYVMAPARLLEHGDSEEGLTLLEELFEKYPDDVQTRLRLAEAYVALDDYEPAFEHLCFVQQHRDELRPDHRALLDDLVAQVDLPPCESER